MSVSLGIDFGTTNTAAALRIEGKTEILNLNNDEGPEKTLRSVIYLAPDGTVTLGQKALKKYLHSNIVTTDSAALKRFVALDDKGEARFWDEGLVAHLALQPSQGRLMQSFKSFLSSPQAPKVRLGTTQCEIVDLIAKFFSYIKEVAEIRAGETITSVTLGRPVLFSPTEEYDQLAQSRLEDAARRAGFIDIRILTEPVAACLSYLDELHADGSSTVVVGDFGGGTSDFTVVQIEKKGSDRTFNILAQGGVYIGGDSFNSKIMDVAIAPFFGKDVTHSISLTERGHLPYWLTANLCQWHKLPFMNDRKTLQTIESIRATADDVAALNRLQYLITQNKGYHVYRAIDEAKIQLTDTDNATVTYADEVLHLVEQITRQEFETLIAEDISQIEECIARTVQYADALKIDAVLLTGGTGFIPAVRSIFSRVCPTVPIVQLDAFVSVAAGLALPASETHNQSATAATS